MSRAHSRTFPSLHLRHSSFSNPSVALPTSQLILQPFRHFTYVTSHSSTFSSLHLRHFTYVTAHSLILLSLYLRRSSFANSSVASPTSQLILQPFFRFSYFTGSSLTSPGEPPMASTSLVITRLGSLGVYQKAVYFYCCVVNVSFVKFTDFNCII